MNCGLDVWRNDAGTYYMDQNPHSIQYILNFIYKWAERTRERV